MEIKQRDVESFRILYYGSEFSSLSQKIEQKMLTLRLVIPPVANMRVLGCFACAMVAPRAKKSLHAEKKKDGPA